MKYLVLVFLISFFSCSEKSKVSIESESKEEIIGGTDDHDIPCDGPDEIVKKIEASKEKAADEGFDLSKTDEGCTEDEEH